MTETEKLKRVNSSEFACLKKKLLEWAELSGEKSRLILDEPLRRHSSLRIGGPARFWLEVGSEDDMASFLDAVKKTPWFCVGLGSNTLFPDDGIEFPVVRLVDELASWKQVEDRRVEVFAGAINAHLVRALLKQGLTGAEFLALIPGTFGGAVALNAGTREKELSEILEAVTLFCFDEQAEVWTKEVWPAEKLAMSYRKATLPSRSFVFSGVIRLERGDAAAAKKRVKSDKERRNRTQPYRLASVGSTFANPPGDYAGRLIEAVGLKGVSVGDARVSELHANFFINDGDATAEDFLGLMALARHRVRSEYQTELRPEVKFVGFDGQARMRDLEREWKDKDV